MLLDYAYMLWEDVWNHLSYSIFEYSMLQLCMKVFHLWSVEDIVTTLDIHIHRGHRHCDSFTVCIRQMTPDCDGRSDSVRLTCCTAAFLNCSHHWKTFSSTLGNIRAVSMGNPVMQRQSGDPDKWDDNGDCCTNEQEIEFSPRLSLHPPDKTVLKCYNK